MKSPPEPGKTARCGDDTHQYSIRDKSSAHFSERFTLENGYSNKRIDN